MSVQPLHRPTEMVEGWLWWWQATRGPPPGDPPALGSRRQHTQETRLEESGVDTWQCCDVWWRDEGGERGACRIGKRRVKRNRVQVMDVSVSKGYSDGARLKIHQKYIKKGKRG